MNRPLVLTVAGLLAVPLLGGCVTRTVTVVQTVTATPGPVGSTGDPGGLGGAASASPGDGTDAYASLDPCTLVTQAEASTLAAATMLPGASVPGQSCEYDTDPNGATSQVMVFIGAGAKQTFDLDHSLAHTFAAVPGIGDEAWIEPDVAFARKGTEWVQVGDNFLGDSPDARARLTAALTTAVSRL